MIKTHMEKHTIIASQNIPDGHTCVDYFQRHNGSFGFEEYRRDPEDNRGWFVVGFYGHNVFKSLLAAEEYSLKKIGWLKNL